MGEELDDDELGADLTGEFLAFSTPAPTRPPGQRSMLLVLVGAEAGRAHPVDGEVVIGRGAGCDIRAVSTLVSRRHARIVQTPSGATLEDLGSRNGTFLNSERIGAPAALRFGDRIELGELALLFKQHDPLESRLRERQQMEAIGRIAAGVSHDFNNVVGAALATVHHLQERMRATGWRDAEGAECCADLELALTRAADLTRALATLGRRAEGAELVPVDVSDVCNEVGRLCRRTFGVAHRVELEVEPGLVVRGSRTELHQILLNLGLNARDAMPEGGRLTIAASRVKDRSSGAASVCLRVWDTGEGMDRATVARIFEPFFTTKGAGRGSGIGLSTVAELVRGMGARIDVDSEPGRGTTFTILIPALTEEPAPAPRSRISSGTIPAETGEPPVGSVIVADDQAILRRSVGRMLSAAGHTVMYARDGAEALRLYANCVPRPEVLLVDLDMPGVGGEQVLRSLAVEPDAPAVIIMSGHWDPQRAEELTRHGAAKYLTKPFDAAALRRTVSALCAEVAARRRGPD